MATIPDHDTAPDGTEPDRTEPDRTAPADTAPGGNGREPLWRQLVGEELRARRRERGQTLVETARRAGVSPQYLSEMERGTKDASSEMVAAVSGALDLPLLDLTSAVAENLRMRSGAVATIGSPVRVMATVSAFARSAFALAA